MINKKRDHTELICDISELTGLFSHSSSLQSFLQEIVEMIAEHMHTEVCSIYLYYEDSKELVLRATKGLNPDFIGNVKLKLGEGLTGLAVEQLRPICERQASKKANFRYFPGLGEENYESFLTVPIIRGSRRIGAMVVQNAKKDYFTENDIKALRAITSQLANTIEMTRLILSFEDTKDAQQEVVEEQELSFIKGKVGSVGFAHAPIIVHKEELSLRLALADKNLEQYTLEDFNTAVEETEKELEAIQKEIEETLSDVASLIFTAQILMLKDKGFIDAIVDKINNGQNPPLAISDVVDSYVQKFEELPDAYLREKSHDVRDIGKRLLESLIGREAYQRDYAQHIIIAHELLPSEALKLSTQKVKGIIVLSGGVTSHLSILAQSLQIPLIIADVKALLTLPQNTSMIMDAEQGNIYVNPTHDIINSFKDRQDAQDLLEKQKAGMSTTTQSKDGHQVTLLANINLLGDLKNARDFKAEGIGLYRTEFPFIVRSDFPNEEEQYVIYKKLVEGMPNCPITFRTLDIGGDKALSYFEDHIKEANPYLGMRSIRFSLKHKDIFEQQVRAILRAGHNANLRIMFPMISSVDEFRESKLIVMQCIKALKKEKVKVHSKPKIGMMVELPSVLEIIDDLAKESDFFSIGTNDFIQYMLAVDRTNQRVADQFLPHHPSILRALKRIVDGAQKRNKDVSICGDMAHEEKYIPYIIGLGIRQLSVNPTYLPKIQNLIKQLDVVKAQKLTTSILKKSRIRDIHRIIEK